jgi:hypothetical protein
MIGGHFDPKKLKDAMFHGLFENFADVEYDICFELHQAWNWNSFQG